MSYDDQIQSLKSVSPLISSADEGGLTYILIKQVELPTGCIPERIDVLLCPLPKDGYNSRLFFPEQITGDIPARNWNGAIRILDRNWTAMSWAVPAGLDLLSMLSIHLRALRNDI